MALRTLAVLAASAAAATVLACALPLPPGEELALGPGHEAAIEALVLPYRDGAAVGDEVTLSGIAIVPDRVVYALTSGTHDTAQVILELPERGGQPMILATPAVGSAALRDAQERLAAAIARRDNGALSRSLVQSNSAKIIGVSLNDLGTRAILAAWWFVAFAVVARGLRMLRDRRSPRARAALVAGLFGVLGVAALVRAQAPLTPLRPNGHAYTDFAIAMALPEAAAEYRQTRLSTGAAWIDAQRVLVRLAGRHHDGVGHVAIAVGALACLLASGAVFAASKSVVAAIAAGLVLALAPAAVRVGHSESPLVFAQFLVAAVLWLGGGRVTALARAGMALALLLLAFGHVMGAALAVSALLAVFALAWHPPARDASWPAQWSWRRLAPWVLVLLLVAAAGCWQASRYVASKAGSVQGGIVLVDAVRVWRPLWGRLDFGAPLAVVAGLLGVLAWLRAQPPRAPRVRLALVLGGLAVTALLPMAPLARGDGSQLRYEATLGPLLVLMFAPLPLLLPPAPLRARWRWGVGTLVALLLLPLTLADAGRRRLDTQGQSYSELRKILGQRRGVTPIFVPLAPQRAVRMTAPIGAWTAHGPIVRALDQSALDAACRAGQHVDTSAVLVLDAACVTAPIVGLAPAPCAALAAYVDPQRILERRRFEIPVGGVGEFHYFRTQDYTWQLSGVRCPVRL